MNKVFIAASIDGYIADKAGNLDWLQSIPNPEGIDMGFKDFMQSVDALVMGRGTFETVCSFDMEWPYEIPVFVLSRTLTDIPEKAQGKAEIVKGNIQDVLKKIHAKGYLKLYIDGGITIQRFLKEDLIDELIITSIPILLGGGVPLFSELKNKQEFTLIKSEVFLNEIVQSHYKRQR